MVVTLAGLYRRYPREDGEGWFGPNPLAGEFPRKTRDWGCEIGHVRGIRRALWTHSVTRNHGQAQAIAGLIDVGPSGPPLIRTALKHKSEPGHLATIARALGESRRPHFGSPRGWSRCSPIRRRPERSP